MTGHLELNSLGQIRLHRDGAPVLAGRRKLLILLAFLARRNGRSIGRVELASLFWPDAEEPRARQSLRQALVELREVVREGLEAGEQEVRLDPAILSLDANRLEEHLSADALHAADQQWQGDFLPGAEVDAGEALRSWLETEREHLRRRRAALGARLVAEAEQRGAWREALAHALRWRRDLPDDESALARARSLERLAEPSTTPRPPEGILLTPDLVGREAEFARLTATWAEVRGGAPGLVLIEGEEGSGKSRLVEEFLRWVRRGDARTIILRTHGFAAERDRDLLLTRHLLAPLAAAPGVAAAPASALRSLVATSPEFADRFPALASGPAAGLADAVTKALEAVAAESPIVVAVDEAHLADPASADLLSALYRRPVAGALLILASAPAVFALGDLERRPVAAGQLHRIPLGGFDQKELEQVLASMAEFRAADRSALAKRLLVDTDGNPLAAIELTAALVDHGLVRMMPDGLWTAILPPPEAPLPLPSSLVETIRARTSGLDSNALRTLEAAAVLGRLVDDRLLGQVTGLRQEVLASAVGELLTRRLLRPSPEQPGTLDFTHEMLRRIVYDGLDAATRRDLHRRALAALRHRGGRDSGMQAAIAHHRAKVISARPVRGWIIGAGLAVAAIGGVLVSRRTATALPRRFVLGAFTGVDSGATDLAGPVATAIRLELEEGAPRIELDGTPGSTTASGRDSESLRIEGTLQVTGGRLRLAGSMRDPASGRIVRRASAEGDAAAVTPLAAHLVQELVPELGAPVPFELAAARSNSPQALAAYLGGVAQARARDFEAAAQSYWRATRLDPDLAVAWHALARINAWYYLPDRASRMADSAVAHDRALLPHEQLLLLGWQEFAHGRAAGAEAQFRQVLSISREDEEARVGLAEVLFHHNWIRGRSMTESGEPWDQVARQHPTDWRPGVHRWEVAARKQQWPLAQRLLAETARASRDTSAVTKLLLRQLGGDSTTLVAAIRALPADNEWSLMQLATWEGTTLARLDLARETLDRLTEPTHSPVVRALGFEQLAWIDLAGGHWRSARTDLKHATDLEPVSAATVQAALWAAPFLPPILGDSGRDAERKRLAHAPIGTVSRSFLFWLDYDRGREGLVRRYLAALLARESGDQAQMGPLSAAGTGVMRDSLAELEASLATSDSAWGRLAIGDSAGAAALLAGGFEGSEASRQDISIFWARPWDLYELALLQKVTRRELAADLLNQLGPLSLATLPYLAPAQLERGRILESLGRRADAITAYQTGIRLWEAGDPEFQDQVQAARNRLHSLETSSQTN